MKKKCIFLAVFCSAVLLSFTSCGSSENSVKEPVETFFDGVNNNNIDKCKEAFGEDLLTDLYSIPKDDIDDCMKFSMKYWREDSDTVEYTINSTKKIKDDEKEEMLTGCPVDIDELYEISLDVKGGFGEEWETMYTGKVDGKWVLLDWEDMFDLY